MKNSDLRLDDDVRTLLEQELGATVPNPNSPEFQSFLEELQVERPDLFDEVMRGLQVNVMLPVEQQAQRAARRDGINQGFTRAFFQRSKVDGESIPAKRRIMTYLFGTLALLLPLTYILAQAFPDGSALSASQEPRVQVESEPRLQPQPDVNLQTPTKPEIAMPTPEPRATLKEPKPEPRKPTPPKPQQTVLPPPGPPTPEPPQAAANVPRAPAPIPSPTPSLPSAPQSTSSVPESVPSASTEVYRAENTRSPSTLVYQAPQSEGAGLQVYQQESVPPAPLSLPIEPQGAERPANLSVAESTGASQNVPPQETVLFDLNAQAGDNASASGGAGGNTEGQPEGASALPPFTLPLGSRIQATLATGIFVAEGAAVPVVAETEGDWCVETPCQEITWLGQARLDITNRVQVTFDQAIMDGVLQNVTGLALDPDVSTGLSASLRDEASLSAENLLRNGVAGVSDYVDALTSQQKVTFRDGFVTTETNVPDVDAFIAGRIASLFDSPVARGPTIRIAEIPSGTPFLVLYGVSSPAEPTSAE